MLVLTEEEEKNGSEYKKRKRKGMCRNRGISELFVDTEKSDYKAYQDRQETESSVSRHRGIRVSGSKIGE